MTFLGPITLLYTLVYIEYSVRGFAIPVIIAGAGVLCAFCAKRGVLLRVLTLIVFTGLVVILMFVIVEDIKWKRDATLGTAIVFHDLELMKRKIAEGYDVNGKTADGCTMLTRACHMGLMRESDADVEDPEEFRGELIYGMLTILLGNGASETINALDDISGQAPLHYVSSRAQIYPDDQLRIIDLLISYGADINLKDRDGRTPLNLAVYLTAFYQVNNLEAVKYLVEKGADVNIADKEGKTPLKIALERDKTKEIAEFLRQYGAKE